MVVHGSVYYCVVVQCVVVRGSVGSCVVMHGKVCGSVCQIMVVSVVMCASAWLCMFLCVGVRGSV